jgi:hypothetical protein
MAMMTPKYLGKNTKFYPCRKNTAMPTGSHVLVYKVNKHLKAALKNKNNITYWEHRGIWKNTANLMCPDLVHLNKSGMEIYAKSARAAVGSDKRR